MTEITPTDASESTAPTPPGEIIAYAGSWYRQARYIMAIIVFGCAAWFAYDGWVGWPQQNADHHAARDRGEKPEKPLRSDLEIGIQRLLATTLPFLGISIIVWLRYNSRGCVRLKDDVLYAPGHPAVPLDAIRQIDKSKWGKKGIAYLDYEIEATPNMPEQKGTVKLDDFVYQQDPIDAILETIEKKLAPDGEVPPKEE